MINCLLINIEKKMSRSNFVIAPFKISLEKSCMVMINNGDIHFLDHNGQEIDRETLDLPSVFVLSFQDGEDRSYTLAKEGEEYENANLYVVNKDNKVIYSTRNGEFKTFCRIADDSIIIGVKEIVKTADILTCKNKSGILVANNKLTNHGYVGAIDNYYLFVGDTNYYHIYKLFSYSTFDDETDSYEIAEEMGVYTTKPISLDYVKSFRAEFLILWRRRFDINVIYFEIETPNKLFVENLPDYFDNNNKKEFCIDSDLSSVNWKEDVQILNDESSIIFQYCNASSNYNGFTIIFEYDNYKGECVLLNQKRLGYIKPFELYSNSLILTTERASTIIYTTKGEVAAIAKNRFNKKYITFEACFRGPWLPSPIANRSSRYGVIRLTDLQIIVPPNFNKIDYVTISYYYDQDENPQEIYIKACIEYIDENGKSIKYWGLFKESKLILPVHFKNIEIISINKHMMLMIESAEGLKGIFYKGNMLIYCVYQSITTSRYLIMKKSDGMTDLLYFYYGKPILLEGFSSILHDYGKVIFVERNGKHGIIVDGKMILDCVCDEIKLIYSYPNWFSLRIDNKLGVYGDYHYSFFISKFIYSDVKVINCGSWDGDRDAFVLKLDGVLYSIGESEKRICENDGLSFKGFISSKVLAFSDEKGENLELYDYRGKKKEYAIIYIDSDGNICEKELGSQNHKYAILKSQNYKLEQYVFSFADNDIIENPMLEEEYDYYEDTYDYERDTYYALGGDDYDAFKERGGDIDDMMDRMGF